MRPSSVVLVVRGSVYFVNARPTLLQCPIYVVGTKPIRQYHPLINCNK